MFEDTSSGKSAMDRFTEYGLGMPKDASRRLEFLMDLIQRLNHEFLDAQDATEILKAVMVGVTAGEGLGFNRVFWFELDNTSKVLKGSLSLGPCDCGEATEIWSSLEQQPKNLFEMLREVSCHFEDLDHPLNRGVRSIEIPLDGTHFLAKSLRGTVPLVFPKVPEGDHWPFGDGPVAVVPVFTGPHLYGVLACDNQILRSPISQKDLEGLVLFATIVSMAMTKARLCRVMHAKLKELETLTMELNQSKDRLVKAEKVAALGMMADNVLHEVRNPLSAVGGLAGLMRKRSKDPWTKDVIEKMVEGIKRIDNALNRLENVKQTQHVNREKVHFQSFMETIFRLISLDLQKKGIDGCLNMSIGDVNVELDVSRFQQCIFHVINNAVGHIKRGILYMTVQLRSENVELDVYAKGVSLSHPVDEIDNRPLGMVPKSLNGLGFGLTLAKEIVELHGGSFEVCCDATGENRVRILIPACPVSHESSRP